jgi:chemotaxis protein MotB
MASTDLAPWPVPPARFTFDSRPSARPGAGFLRLIAAVFASVHASAGCVPTDTYDQAMAKVQETRAEAENANSRSAKLSVELKKQHEEASKQKDEALRLGKELDARDSKLNDLTVARSNDAKKLDDLTALNEELSQRLRAAGKSAEALAGEKGSLSKTLEETKKRLEELRRQQAAAEARAAEFRELVARFRKLIDAGQLKVVTRGGRMLIELPNDILFDSGKTELRDAGKKALTEVAGVLRSMPDRRFQVAGHTDNVKIQTARFPSNWELSTARAVEVVKLLADAGMPAQSLSAAGYGEFSPVEANDTPDRRAKNRRIEIALVPNLDELVALPPEASGAAPAAPAAAAPPAAPPVRR